MDRQFRVAVIGATGLIGETLITVLEERGFPVSQLYALASNRSLGRSASFRGRSYPVQELADFDFTHCDLALFCAGRAAVEELARQSIAALSGQGTVAADAAIGRIAFNCVPHIDAFQDNGYTRAEMRLVWETRKVLGDAALRVNATAVRVPVFYGHCEAVHIQTRRALSATQARELLRKAPGVTVMDERVAGGYPTAATEAAKRDTVYVGRIREYLAPDRGLNLWIVADNVRKGAATNSVQIAEAWAQRTI